MQNDAFNQKTINMTTSNISLGIVEFAGVNVRGATASVKIGYTPAVIRLHCFEPGPAPFHALPVKAEIVWRSYADNAILVRLYDLTDDEVEVFFIENTLIRLTERGFYIKLDDDAFFAALGFMPDVIGATYETIGWDSLNGLTIWDKFPDREVEEEEEYEYEYLGQT